MEGEASVVSLPMQERQYTKSKRVSWDEFFMSLVDVCEKQSTCLLKHVGAVLVKNRRVISAGYNGPPAGISHCRVCVRKEANTKSYAGCPSVHSEINCIIQCARFGVSTENATIYVKYFPCWACTCAIINAMIKRIVFEKAPVDDIAVQLAVNAGIEVYKYKDREIKKLDIRVENLPWE